MFKGIMTVQDQLIYREYLRLVEILTTDEYSGMYDKIGAIRSKMVNIEELMDEL